MNAHWKRFLALQSIPLHLHRTLLAHDQIKSNLDIFCGEYADTFCLFIIVNIQKCSISKYTLQLRLPYCVVLACGNVVQY